MKKTEAMMPDARARRMMPPTTSAIDLIHCSMAGSFVLVLVDGANIQNSPETKNKKVKGHRFLHGPSVSVEQRCASTGCSQSLPLLSDF